MAYLFNIAVNSSRALGQSKEVLIALTLALLLKNRR
jgi:hypothetical protein